MVSTRSQFNRSRGCFVHLGPTFDFGDRGLIAVPLPQAC